MKNKLIRIKAGILALMLSGTFMLGGCSKEESEEKKEEKTMVAFVGDKALIYTDTNNNVFSLSVYDGGNVRIDKDIKGLYEYFSANVETILLKTQEEAVTLAESVVGKENIVYIDFEEAENNEYILKIK